VSVLDALETAVEDADMVLEPRWNATVRLRVRTKLAHVSTIHAIPLRQLAQELTGKANLAALFAWCAKEGVGVDGFLLTQIPGGQQGECWLDARRMNGVFFDRVGNVVATLRRGVLAGEPAWSRWLEILPPTTPWEWGSSSAPKESSSPARAASTSKVKPRPATARLDMELTSRAGLEALAPVMRRQLEAASKDLCGKDSVAALMKWCDAQGQGLAHVVVTCGRSVRFEGWLTASLEDGVFFDAAGTKPNGLVMSQLEVRASDTTREGDVPTLQVAMKKLKAPPAPKWRG
jgi:hypothetical protein